MKISKMTEMTKCNIYKIYYKKICQRVTTQQQVWVALIANPTLSSCVTGDLCLLKKEFKEKAEVAL